MNNFAYKAGICLGLLGLSCNSLKAQENPFIVKVGPTYNIVNTNEISKSCFGIETLLEKKLEKRLFLEWEVGLYADTRTTSSLIYSKMQTNAGLEYKPIIAGSWEVGGKLALGVSSEFYKNTSEAVAPEKITINKLIGFDIDKKFRNGTGVNFGVSKEIDRNVWRIGVKAKLRQDR